MNILIIGGGGREHSLAWKVSQSSLCDQLYIAPGNAGTAQLGQNIAIDTTSHQSVINFCSDNKIELVVIGPEAPLVDGLCDSLRQSSKVNLTVVGPGQLGAQLEGSKDFSKQFMAKYDIPTAAYASFDKNQLAEGYAFLEKMKAPYVLKADGLAAGKGVLIIDHLTEAKDSLKTMLDGQFGEASSKVVIEEFLSGIEYSVFVLTDGKDYLLLPEAKDYKRIGEGDTGLNTGGMGAISPVPFVDNALWNKTITKVIEPTIAGLKSEAIDYRGFIFFGLIRVNEEPYVIEYNSRLGDPETEAIIPRIESDLVPALLSLKDQSLQKHSIDIKNDSAATVVLVSGGYPGSYEKGKVITSSESNESIVYHSGTKISNDQLLTNGGRVIAITSLANTKEEAIKKSLATANKIKFEGKYFRTDIGQDL